MLKLCMQDYKSHGVEEIDHGSYTVGGATCIEAQMNGLVSRVSLYPIDYKDFCNNKSKYLTPLKKTKKRKLPRTEDGQVLPRKKIIKTSNIPEVRKEIDLMSPSFNNKLLSHIHKVQKLNGGNLPSKRLRKPNSKFSDYIIPSNYNLAEDQDTQASLNRSVMEFSKIKVTKLFSDGKPRLHKARVKERILAQTDDEHRPDASLTVDPLDLHIADDVVRSFLPVFEPQILNYKDDDSEAKPSTSKAAPSSGPAKTKDTNNDKHVPVKAGVTQPITVFSPKWKGADNKAPQLFGKVLCMPLIVTTNAQNNPIITVNDSINQKTLINKPDQRWVHIQPKEIELSPPDTTISPKNNILKKSTPKSTNITKTKANVNSLPTNKPELKPKSPPKLFSSSRFILVESDTKYKHTKISDIDFNKLVRSLKSVKLPAKNWKIRIIVSPQETITEVIFTNKEALERCVKFSRGVPSGYKITFGKSEVKLLGAPTLQTFDDIALLLEIINTISTKSLVLEYC